MLNQCGVGRVACIGGGANDAALPRPWQRWVKAGAAACPGLDAWLPCQPRGTWLLTNGRTMGRALVSAAADHHIA